MGEVKRSVFYSCPNNCQAHFSQEGVSETVITMTEEGERIEQDNYKFTPTGPVRCRNCNAKAKIRTKTVSID